MDVNTILIVAINLVALGAAYGSLRQEVRDLGRRVGRIETCFNGKPKN